MLKKLAHYFHHKSSYLANPYDYKKAAVFIPFISTPTGKHLLFEVRALTLKWQPGDICFPGGKIEEQDDNPQQTALRETTEELGLHIDDLNLFGALDHFVSPLGLIIYPFCGEILHPEKIHPNHQEVSSTFTVPLSWFINTQPLHKSLTIRSQFNATPNIDDKLPIIDEQWRKHGHLDVLFYPYENRLIWGLTAQLIQMLMQEITLNHLIE